MKKISRLFTVKLALVFLVFALLLQACAGAGKSGESTTSDRSERPTDEDGSVEEAEVSEDATSGEKSAKEEASSEDSSVENQSSGRAGLITAGEWNDLSHWDYWNNLLNGQSFSEYPKYWGVYTNNRISVLVKNGNNPVVDTKVELKNKSNVVWATKTDNFGKAELWIDLFQKNTSPNLNDYSLEINGKEVSTTLKSFQNGINEIQVSSNTELSDVVELAFIVDATGSMGDEIDFLKADLQKVIQRVSDANSALKISTASVFYRDKGDDYVVKHSDFSTKLNTTINYIERQSADGGGDFPEAVHTALSTCVEELSWSENARTRIAFLLLDAPPHEDKKVQQEWMEAIELAAKKGIKIIPITASGINKETEFLMRFFAIITNGTYTFITDDSGIGDSHLEPSIGKYEVEFLNDLMVRLIQKYSKEIKAV